MTRGPLEVIRSGALHPVDNMAFDEVLLAQAKHPTLRLYTWQPAGLSIGWFQRYADFADLPGDHVVVRRRTGGGAIYHEHELTFALAAQADALPPGPVDATYEVLHAAIASALGDCGVPVSRHGRGSASARPEDPWCYAKPTCHDLVTPTGKIVGSAQRRVRIEGVARVLHHGSILLAPPSVGTARCGTAAEFRSVDADFVDALQDALTAAVAAALDRTVVPRDSTAWDAARDAARTEVSARLAKR